MRFRSCSLDVLIIVLLLCAGFNAAGALAMFLKLPGVEGESAQAGHAGEIEVLGFSWGMFNVTSTGGGGTGAGRVTIQDLTLTKPLDLASPKLMLAAANGRAFSYGVLKVQKGGSEAPFEFFTIGMTNVFVTAVNTGGTLADNRLSETVSLRFTRLGVEYTAQSSTGGAGTKTSFNWDIAANTGN